MKKTSEIRIRDPFILPYQNKYYLYGTIGETEGERNLYVFESCDLENWDDPSVIFTLPEDSWAAGEIWAPEVHCYNDRLYLFVSLLGEHGRRGVQIAVSDSPKGEFRCVANRPATPMNKSCIDGTLYVENDVPYMVFSRDWPDNYIQEKDLYIGQIAAIPMTHDLSAAAGEEFVLFESNEAPLSANRPAKNHFNGQTVFRYGSDGPYVQKLPDGRLLILWSPIPGNNYIVASAVSENGTIRGPWTHHTEAVFDKNGGHAMLFTDFSGQMKICMHYPERYFHEHPLILDVEMKDGKVEIQSLPPAIAGKRDS